MLSTIFSKRLSPFFLLLPVLIFAATLHSTLESPLGSELLGYTSQDELAAVVQTISTEPKAIIKGKNQNSIKSESYLNVAPGDDITYIWNSRNADIGTAKIESNLLKCGASNVWPILIDPKNGTTIKGHYVRYGKLEAKFAGCIYTITYTVTQNSTGKTNTAVFQMAVAPKTVSAPVILPLPTAFLLANEQSTLTAHAGDNITYTWKSTNAGSASSVIQSNNNSKCGSGNWTLAGNTPNGAYARPTKLEDKFIGCNYTITYTAIQSPTVKATSVLHLNIVAKDAVLPVTVTPPTTGATPPTSGARTFYFGGMIGYGSKYGGITRPDYPNPLGPITGPDAGLCPPHYDKVKLLETTHLDYALYLCLGDSSKGATKVADFGGLVGYGDHNKLVSPDYLNPTTGKVDCPTGYEHSRVYGTTGVDWYIAMCYKANTTLSTEDAKFKGMIGFVNGLPTLNPVTNDKSCGSDTAWPMFGTPRVDYTVSVCYPGATILTTSGPATGDIGSVLTYTFLPALPSGQSLIIDWGDNTTDTITTNTKTHAYGRGGEYFIRVIAPNAKGFSDPFKVSIRRVWWFGGINGYMQMNSNPPWSASGSANSCNSGYQAYQVLGSSEDLQLYYCMAEKGPGIQKIADFTGIFSYSVRSSFFGGPWGLPLALCPSGSFSSYQIYGSTFSQQGSNMPEANNNNEWLNYVDRDQGLGYCTANTVSSVSPSEKGFGGMYSPASSGYAGYKNAITNTMSCPAGFQAVKVHGRQGSYTHGEDQYQGNFSFTINKDEDLYVCQ